MPRSKSSRRSYRRRRGFVAKRKGGSGDAQSYMAGVVGQYPHSAQAGSNLIAQHPLVENVPAPAPIQQGGLGGLSPSPIGLPSTVSALNGGAYLGKSVGGEKHHGGQKHHGGNVLSEIAVPAVLLIANQTLGKKTGKKFPRIGKKYSRKRRGSRFYRR
jgi:hypothetical protein